ncbi:MAG TPA: malate dehydrogenase, partial [Bacteroidales bacterium]|nr:malate dehydrogenase [Bacteroidales bacterium]
MAHKPIVFACSNPVPEIYPHTALQAGAYIVATGRGDFPNQVNNSIGFPGILKGALLVRARKITDNMAIAAANAIARFAEQRGISPENITARMDEPEVFPIEAADVAMQAIADGVARVQLTWQQAYDMAKFDIELARKASNLLVSGGIIQSPDSMLLQNALSDAIAEVLQKP